MFKIRCAHKILDKALEIHNKRNNKMSYSLLLSEIKQILKKYKLLITTNIKDDDNTVIEKLTYDSRNVDDTHFSYVKVLHLRMITLRWLLESKSCRICFRKYYD